MTRAEAIPNVGQNPLLTLADRKIIPGKWGLDMPAGHLTGHWPFATDGDSSAVARHAISALPASACGHESRLPGFTVMVACSGDG